MRWLIVTIFFAISFTSSLSAQPSVADDNGFVVRDFLGRTWRNEAIRFTASTTQLASARAGLPLVGPDNKPVLYQIVPDAGGSPAAIEFLANLDAFEEKSYRFANDPGYLPASTDLNVDETEKFVRLSNNRTGISVRKKLAMGEGPIEGIRLTSGQWVGNSLLVTRKQVLSYNIEVIARGPVYAEILCDITFGNAQFWRLRLRLMANEPVILVDEEFSRDDDASFQLLLSPRFSPDRLYYRYGKGHLANREGKLATWRIPSRDNHDALAFVLEPWLHWWESERQGTWFGLYNEQSEDLLAIATRAPSRWVRPDRLEERASAQTYLTSARAGLKWTLDFKGGGREWMVSALNKDTSLAPLQSNNLYQAPLPQQYQIKHSAFPLDRIKNYITHWRADEGDHPRLLVTKKDIIRSCNNFHADPTKVSSYRKLPIGANQMDEPILYYLCTKDPELGQNLADTAIKWTQDAVDMLVRQDALVTLGFAPHQQTVIMTAINLADAIWSSSQLSTEMRERLKAQLAFLGYTVNSDDYWSPARGFAANPNMTSTVAAYRALLGAIIPSHPMAATWVRNGTSELKEQLDHWSDENGGWLEAPHYAMLSFDYLLGTFLVAHNGRFNDFLHHPRMKKVAEWFAKISTPSDSGLAGHRHLPPIGNTYLREPTAEFGLVAHLWQNKDPEFAAHMQWMHRQQGSPQEPVLGGFAPMFAGYRQMLLDPSLVAKAPMYASELFPSTGVMLRNHFPSNRETQLYLIAGPNHAHYDQDSGSFTLWGKGRLIANDFGYQGNMPADDHNMIVAPGAPGRAIMKVTAFSAGTHLDYVRGIKSDTWARQIAFIKDSHALGPNYFVIADSLARSESAVWRLWLSADEVAVAGQHALAIGHEDVDTDIYFVHPANVDLTTEQKIRETPGITAGRYGTTSTTQTGLIATNDKGSGFVVVVYPRLKTEEAQPVVIDLADGRVIKVKSAAGTDFIFLGQAPFSYQDRHISFNGTVGLVQIRDQEVYIALGAEGSLKAYGKMVNKKN